MTSWFHEMLTTCIFMWIEIFSNSLHAIVFFDDCMDLGHSEELVTNLTINQIEI